jgi:hypothetical protein
LHPSPQSWGKFAVKAQDFRRPIPLDEFVEHPSDGQSRSTSSSSTALPIGPEISSGGVIACHYVPFSSRNMGRSIRVPIG